MDIKAKLAELRAKKAAESSNTQEIQNAQAQVAEIKETTPIAPVINPVAESVPPSNGQQNNNTSPNTVATNAIAKIGTERTSEIDHMQFMEQLEELKTAIHTQHPKMPVLLMMIHKHLRNDPELVTTLSEEEIGTIVNGLKVQTKTELVGTIAKQTKSRDKKTVLSTDMF